MIREIITYPNPLLKKISKEVVEFDKNLHDFLDDMYDTMVAGNGIGLAAIQVGVDKRILIINLLDEGNEGDEEVQSKENLLEIINPKVLETSGSVTYQEGCLSVPKFYEDVQRYEKITIQYQDRDGNIIKKECDTLLSIAFQHELDHLDGKLFIDKLSYGKRKKFEKEWKKQLKNK